MNNTRTNSPEIVRMVRATLVAASALLLVSCGSNTPTDSSPASTQKPAPTFEWVGWYLTNRYAAPDRLFSITEEGTTNGFCYLVVQCHLLPEITGKDYKLDPDHFRLILAEGSTATLSEALSSQVARPVPGSTDLVVASKGTFLFIVDEARARTGGLSFMFKQHPPVELNAKNHRDAKLNPEF